jgi:hypothetical protein
MSESEREKHISPHHEEEQENGDTEGEEPENAPPSEGDTSPDA